MEIIKNNEIIDFGNGLIFKTITNKKLDGDAFITSNFFTFGANTNNGSIINRGLFKEEQLILSISDSDILETLRDSKFHKLELIKETIHRLLLNNFTEKEKLNKTLSILKDNMEI